MSMDYSVSYDDLEQRRRTVQERRMSAQPKPRENPKPQIESEALAVINEIFNPSFTKPKTKGQYKLPAEMTADDVATLQDMDIHKLAELKEVFVLVDTDCDGLISKDDLRFTFIALGADPSDEFLENMLKEAKEPLNVEAFLELMSHRTVELDSEDVLLEAWSKWDDYGTGYIDEQKMYVELTNYGDKMTTKEANEALRHAPMAKPKTLEEPPMIDYPAFCRLLSGLRKRRPSNEEE